MMLAHFFILGPRREAKAKLWEESGLYFAVSRQLFEFRARFPYRYGLFQSSTCC